MPYSYLEHVSDIGIRAEGSSLKEAFTSGAEAMLGVIFELSTVEETKGVTFVASAPDLPLLFVETLNEMLFIQDKHGLALKRLESKDIKKSDSGYLFVGRLFGEPIDLEKHTAKTEVKAATYSGLSYKETEGKHVFECILDV